jgi:hypothetical protein
MQERREWIAERKEKRHEEELKRRVDEVRGYRGGHNALCVLQPLCALHEHNSCWLGVANANHCISTAMTPTHILLFD